MDNFHLMPVWYDAILSAHFKIEFKTNKETFIPIKKLHPSKHSTDKTIRRLIKFKKNVHRSGRYIDIFSFHAINLLVFLYFSYLKNNKDNDNFERIKKID